MNWRIISASTALAASLLIPMSGMAAPFRQSQTFRSYRVQTVAQRPSNDEMPKKKGRFNKEQRLQRMQQELDLTPEQVRKIQEIHNQAKDHTLKEDMKEAKQKMRQLMAGDGSDGELRRQFREIQNLRRQLSAKRFEKKLAVRNVLTPEQRTKMAEMRQQRRQSRRGMSGYRRGMGF